MSTINLDSVKNSNKRLARVINDLSYILYREEYEVYHNIIINLKFPNDSEHEDKFLMDLFFILLEKIKKLNYGPLINN